MSSVAGDPERRSRWIPWVFVGFFLIVLSVNGVMIFVAFSTWTGLEAQSAYKQGLAYNRALERAEAQEALGWQVAFAFKPAGLGGTLMLDLKDANNDLIEDAQVLAKFERPTHEGHDFIVDVPHHWGGSYRRDLALPLRGLWDVEVEIGTPNGHYRLEERIFLAR